MANAKQLFERRKRSVRNRIAGSSPGRPRLSVYRSGRHIYAQIIDDARGVTVAAASTVEKDIRSSVSNGANTDAATRVGKMIAERGKSAGVEQVVFDRGGYRFHGRIKALADAARESGLDF